MIPYLHLQNFQSHKDTELVFSPGVNVIVGPSDSGKSAIIRGAIWVTTNRPSGESFRSNWGGDTAVTMGLDDSTLLSRERKSNLNAYILNDEVLEGFGTDVPEVVENVLNLGELNIQSQHDAPFLLASNAAEVARLLNKIAHLDEIDSSMSAVNSMIRSARGEIVHVTSQMEENDAALEAYKNLPDQEAELERLEILNARVQDIDKKRIWGEAQVTLIEGVSQDLDSFKRVLVHAGRLKKLEKIHEDLQEQGVRLAELRKLIQQTCEVSRNLDEVSSLLTSEKDVDVLMDKQLTIEAVELKAGKLKALIAQLETVTGYVNTQETLLQEKTQEFEHIKPDVCPVCEQEWPK